MDFIPLHDRVLLKRNEITGDEVRPSGIVVPEVAREKPVSGTVVAIGGGRVLENGIRVPLDLKVGDVVDFGRFSGTELSIDEEKYVIMREDEVLGIRWRAKERPAPKPAH